MKIRYPTMRSTMTEIAPTKYFILHLDNFLEKYYLFVPAHQTIYRTTCKFELTFSSSIFSNYHTIESAQMLKYLFAECELEDE